MEEKKVNEISHQFLNFILSLKLWLKENYLKEFNINGKGNCSNLTGRQFTILVIVHQFECCTISDLEKELNVSNSSLSIVVSKLVKEGYLKRTYPSEEEDRRKTYISLTPKGISVLTEVYERIIKIFGDFYCNLDEKKQKDFEEGLKKLSAIFGS
ncbi:MarR family winged helix-turn-helix transcriptional regulator [Defluviitalea raffinosedens]|jgi:MarR family 2-MHQ and catechol resistance regulon transcriptional repressor|uniref:MarR family transcriptional regulator n=1 Tax=Defluviitalea raffinosedens TaxID=1450156 RepID=A0A7C8LR72_9FIRM|nr:MarR family transcriptional regulator [Defluviitalea raffinosedens]KAE9636281.1 MarR family transcriptional regulator [Defluviitalea raffinosedens]MBM7685418.1 DNA-binding MarR family transcriptional regulator [Defluviitalea raffinosedens]MBZ4667740.1 MarR family protein [Defluviitaleaceae bacterium]HHW66261.1 MarR family transcriptional regulator [Candidatus Epulonipiscium sp.]